ncbi:hypothetical protein Tco_0773040 [Tanacetum coccineum]|uniref:Uncharacterized protein n=1 Tax=Tanacetum coccineum TaxID=301880 RepID=A0ABQ4ZJR1_9ASTR
MFHSTVGGLKLAGMTLSLILELERGGQSKVFCKGQNHEVCIKVRLSELSEITRVSPGGSTVASLRISKLLCRHTRRITLLFLTAETTIFEPHILNKRVIPKVVFDVFEKLLFLLRRHPFDHKIPRMVVCKMGKPWGIIITTKGDVKSSLEQKNPPSNLGLASLLSTQVLESQCEMCLSLGHSFACIVYRLEVGLSLRCPITAPTAKITCITQISRASPNQEQLGLEPGLTSS